MQINQQDKFKLEFKQILEHIAKDKLSASKRFKKELLSQIKSLPNFPYKYRSSHYSDNENVRDMIFRGYTLVYRVDKNKIDIITIFNQNLPVLNEDI